MNRERLGYSALPEKERRGDSIVRMSYDKGRRKK